MSVQDEWGKKAKIARPYPKALSTGLSWPARMTPADSQLGQGKPIFPPCGPPQVNMLTNMQNRKQIAIHFRQHDDPISDSFYCSHYFFPSERKRNSCIVRKINIRSSSCLECFVFCYLFCVLYISVFKDELLELLMQRHLAVFPRSCQGFACAVKITEQ